MTRCRRIASVVFDDARRVRPAKTIFADVGADAVEHAEDRPQRLDCVDRVLPLTLAGENPAFN